MRHKGTWYAAQGYAFQAGAQGGFAPAHEANTAEPDGPHILILANNVYAASYRNRRHFVAMRHGGSQGFSFW